MEPTDESLPFCTPAACLDISSLPPQSQFRARTPGSLRSGFVSNGMEQTDESLTFSTPVACLENSCLPPRTLSRLFLQVHLDRCEFLGG